MVMIMANLEVEKRMTPYQLTAVIIATAFGAQIVLSPQKLLGEAETGIILAIVLGGVLFCGVTLLMLRLGKYYPTETFVEYMPKLWGQTLGGVILWWFVAVFLLQITVVFNGFGRVITLLMFDRTPPQVIEMGLLVVCVYCAVQEFGTILRIQQITLIVSGSILLLTWSTSLLNFQVANVSPLLPQNVTATLKAVFDTWGMYSGYEIVLLLLPLVCRGQTSVTRSATIAFVVLIFIFEFLFIIIIGVMTVKSAASVPYPTVFTMKAVELPGTFIERLENYLLLAWVPSVFDTIAMMLYAAARVIARRYHYSDHRPVVLLLAPLLFAGSVAITGVKIYASASQVLEWIGLGFSLIVIPISLFLAWRQKRGVNSATEC